MRDCIGKAGGVIVFKVCYDMCSPMGSHDEKRYKLYCKMPQVKTTAHKSFQDAKEKALEIYEAYIRKFIQGKGK